MRRLRVGLLPTLIEPESLQDQVVVVVDILRATTTICMALTRGARSIVPAHSIPAAHQYRAAAGTRSLCWEVNGAASSLTGLTREVHPSSTQNRSCGTKRSCSAPPMEPSPWKAVVMPSGY